MRIMKHLNRESRLAASSHEELVDLWEEAITQSRSGVRYQGRKLRPGPALNALVLWFAELPDQERIRIVAEAVPRLERFLAEEEMNQNPNMPKPKPKLVEDFTQTGKQRKGPGRSA